MNDEKPVSEKPSAKKIIGEAKIAADKAATIADTANNALSAIKWTAIAIVVIVLGLGGVGIYKAISAPAKAIGNAADGMGDAIKSGATSVKDGTSGLINRLVIPLDNQDEFDSFAEAAFTTVTDMATLEPTSIKDRAFKLKNFPGHEGRVCELSMRFGDTPLPVLIAADNKAYLTAKSLGSKTDRLMRILIRAEGDDIAFLIEWDAENESWVLKWKASTLKKPINDSEARSRIISALGRAASNCK